MTAGTGLLSLVVIILGLGVVAQVLADRLEIPSVLFLILAGVAVGPEGLDLVGLDSFGGPESLSAIVGLSVAIIIFEGAFHLKLDKLRQAPREAFRLITVGAFFTNSFSHVTLETAESWLEALAVYHNSRQN